MQKQFWTAMIAVAMLPGVAAADPWKDESGHGRRGGEWGRGERFGETPAWARGRGYWDGHFKHGHPYADRGHAFRPPVWQGPGFYPQYVPPRYAAPRWRGDRDDYKEWEKERREWLKERREREREAYQEWREWQRENARYGRYYYRPYSPVAPYPWWR